MSRGGSYEDGCGGAGEVDEGAGEGVALDGQDAGVGSRERGS